MKQRIIDWLYDSKRKRLTINSYAILLAIGLTLTAL